MLFGLSPEQSLMQESVKGFLSDRVPLARVRQFAEGRIGDKEIWKELVELGIPGLLIPESAGGAGLGCLDAAVLAECFGYHITPAPFLGSAVVAATALKNAGSRNDVLPALAAGEMRIGVAFGEAVGRRADSGIRIAASKITGKCLYALDARADFYLVASREQHLYLISSQARGLSRKNLTTVDRSRTTCELVFDHVPADLISDDPAIYSLALDTARVMLAADTLGAAQCMLDQAVAYARQREQFKRVIASFQAVKHMCADMAANLEPCRAFLWYAAHALDHVPAERRLLACQLKAHLSEVARQIAKTATEVHGGMGFTDLLGLHYWFKRIGANHQLLGSPELLREEAARVQNLVQ